MEEQAQASVEILRETSSSSREDGEKAFQRALSKLSPGSSEFRNLLRSRRMGRTYKQPLMYWASEKGRHRGRS